MTTKARVEELIRQAVTSPDLDLTKLEERTNRIFGEVRSPIFANMSAEERTKWVTDTIRIPLMFDGLNVGVIVPLAPDEDPW